MQISQDGSFSLALDKSFEKMQNWKFENLKIWL